VPSKPPNKLLHPVPAVFLVLALLCTQWAGLLHSVTHAGWQTGYARTVSVLTIFSDGGNSKETLSHSCSIFDASTLADIVHVMPAPAPLLAGVQILALWSAFSSWNPPFPHHFSPRAPPPA
jgi:hypothetical protein